KVKSDLAARLVDELRATADPRVLGQGDAFDDYPYRGTTKKPPANRK
ncbi:MAG: hypothetical protein ISS74_10300, partial [Planctomycetes bacterium]|nr:hypothetical protein [Planctomycetota bacterium]